MICHDLVLASQNCDSFLYMCFVLKTQCGNGLEMNLGLLIMKKKQSI